MVVSLSNIVHQGPASDRLHCSSVSANPEYRNPNGPPGSSLKWPSTKQPDTMWSYEFFVSSVVPD
jgi:hypothetical protein